MEKERDEAEQLKLQAAVAEGLAAHSKAEESKSSELSSTGAPQSPSSAMQQEEQKGHSKLKSKDEPIVVLPEKDFLAMKARLDAMEDKMKRLESARPGTTSKIPLDSEANPQREPTKENGQKPAVQAADQRKSGGEDVRNSKQKDKISPAVQNQKDLQASQGYVRSWFGFRSKPQERDRSE